MQQIVVFIVEIFFMLQKPRQQVWQAAIRVKLRIIDIFIDGKLLF